MLRHLKDYLFLYLLFCLVGAGLEWSYGTFWNIVGTTPWIYPNSPLTFTSLEGVPLWGLGGWLTVCIYKSVIQRKAKLLAGVLIPLALAALWICFYSLVVQ